MSGVLSWRGVGAALAGLALATLPEGAAAQLSTRGGPIAYSADSLEYFDDARRLVLRGSVEVVQDDATLRAQTLTLFFSRSSQAAGQAGMSAGDIERIEAEGEVFYIRPEQTARGNRAVYQAANGVVTFTGDVVVASPENVIRGETLTLEINGGRTAIRPPAGGRVQGAFSGRQSNQPR